MEEIFVADECVLTLEGKTYSYKCADVTNDTKFEWAGEDKQMLALTLMMACALAEKFGENGKYWYSNNRGGSFSRSYSTTYTKEGNAIILNENGKIGPPRILEGDTLTATHADANGNVITITYKRQ